MDNFDKIKFKKTENENWFIKIDLQTGEKQSFPKKHGFYQEMQAWEAAGNVIEEAETAEEKAIREAEEAETALNSQKSICIQLRRDAEYHFSPNARFKDPADVEKWRIFCDQLDVIIESNEIQEIPEKPFS